ncbi:MAG: dihydroorotase [Candidatus Poriferisodalaceae bacterium]|jgi:dihydroorotase
MTDPALATASITIAEPDDWHVHLRDDHMLSAVAPWTADSFRYALVMPNLTPPLLTSAAAAAYRQRILDAAGPNASGGFTPLMTLYLNDGIDPDDLRAGAAAGLVSAVKFYPAGATTNSDHGGESIIQFAALIDVMIEIDLPLLVHAESTDPTVDIFDREARFLDEHLVPLCETRPELRVTVEHLSTRAGVEFVSSHLQVKGSITPHHLTCDRSHLLANGLLPDLYCKPIINSADDREALAEAALSGSSDFFLGTDSAPHPSTHKHTAQARPGIFNAPYALPVVAELFHQAGVLDRLEGFTSVHGAEHYGFAKSERQVRLTRADTGFEPVSTVTTADGQSVRVFGVDEARLWTVERV